MSRARTLSLELTVQGPFISQDVSAGVFGIDTALMRNDQGAVILPGTQMKGLLRQVFKQALDAGAPGLDLKWIKRWFGSESGSLAKEQDGNRTTPHDYQPDPGQLLFSDLCADAAADKGRGPLTRVQVDDDRGSVAEGMLQVVEAPWTYGDTITFAGTISALGTGCDADLAILRTRLNWALAMIPAVGAFKTAGFGRLKCASLGKDWSAGDPLQSGDVDAIRAAGGASFELTPQSPFLVEARSFGGNYFAGDAIIPGQVLKAVAARWLTDHGLLPEKDDALAGLVFRHAHPVLADAPSPVRPMVPPLSLYSWREGEGFQVADYFDEPEAFEILSDSATFAFSPDWKPIPLSVEAAYPRENPPRSVRTRTAVTEKGVAEDAHLFSYAAVEPARYQWLSEAIIPPDADADTAQDMAVLLSALNGEIRGLGKTKASVAWRTQPLKPRPTASKRGESWRVVLQTPACLHGPSASRPDTGDPIADLQAIYEGYWRYVLSEPDVTVRFIARQHLAGGYLGLRYPISRDGYEPYVLTNLGSVFVLAGPDTMAAKLERFALCGLPLGPGWPPGQVHWKHHPFLPEAGWGEVSISGEDPLQQEPAA